MKSVEEMIQKPVETEKPDENNDKNESETSIGQKLIMKEVTETASCLHSSFILPWYSYVTPDHHYSHQVNIKFNFELR